MSPRAAVPSRLPSADGSLSTFALVAPSPQQPPQLREISVAAPGPNEVRVRIGASGVCHTDKMVTAGNWWHEFPYVLGHEGAGEIESVGSGVPANRVGERVVLAWRVPCRRCRMCRQGRDRFCVDLHGATGRLEDPELGVLAPSLRLGTHAGYAVVNAEQAIPVSSVLPPHLACLLGCAVITGVGGVFNSAQVRPGQSVAVFGVGGVGLSVVQGARLALAGPIIAVDVDESKLETALAVGATHAVLARDGDLDTTVRELAGGLGVDHAFEAAGLAATTLQAVRSCDVAGTCTILGSPSRGSAISLRLEELYLPRLTIRVSQYGDGLASRDLPWLSTLATSGALNLGVMVTKVIKLADAPQAVAAVGQSGIRTVVSFP